MYALKIPKISAQTEDAIVYRVPSKSRKELMQILVFEIGEETLCTCEGAYWIKQQGLDKTCRHHKETTIQTSNSPLEALNHAQFLIRKRMNGETIWSYISCLHPEKRGELRCTGCQLYPKVCNIHLVRIGNKKPLIWKLQTAIYNRKMKIGKKLIQQIKQEERKCTKTTSLNNSQQNTTDLQSTTMKIANPQENGTTLALS